MLHIPSCAVADSAHVLTLLTLSLTSRAILAVETLDARSMSSQLQAAVVVCFVGQKEGLGKGGGVVPDIVLYKTAASQNKIK